MKKILLLSIAIVLLGLSSFAQWVVQPSGTTNNLTSVYFMDADTGHSVGVWADTVLITTDGGTTWNNQVSGTQQPLNSVFFTDADTGYAVGYSGTILKTVNGGTNWITQVSGTTTNLLSVGFFNADTGYAIGYDSLLKTTNGGETWTAKPTSGTGGFPVGGGSGYFTDANIGYQVRYESAFGTHGVISKTVDGGINWWDYWISIPVLGVCFPDDTTGYVVGGRYYIDGSSAKIILKTTNGGETWTEQPAPINIPLRSVFFSDTNTGYAVGDSGTILKTINGGTLWTLQNSATFNRLLSVYFIDSITGYIVGEYGTILRTTNGGGTVGIIEKPVRSSQFAVRSYPNPFSSSTTFEYMLVESGMVRLEIFNQVGQLVAMLVNGQQTAGKQQVSWNAEGVPSGIYFYSVRSGKKVQTGKIIVM